MAEPPVHLVVVQHGLWGQPSHTARLCAHLEQALAQRPAAKKGLVQYSVVNSELNAGQRTYDGIDACGDRLVELVLAFEESFDLDIPDEDTEKIRSVKNAVEYIQQHSKKAQA